LIIKLAVSVMALWKTIPRSLVALSEQHHHYLRRARKKSECPDIGMIVLKLSDQISGSIYRFRSPISVLCSRRGVDAAPQTLASVWERSAMAHRNTYLTLSPYL
jgi:hypothetical protein